MIVEILKKKAKWFWRLKARNGQILAHSEQFDRRDNAIRAARSFSRLKVTRVKILLNGSK